METSDLIERFVALHLDGEYERAAALLSENVEDAERVEQVLFYADQLAPDMSSGALRNAMTTRLRIILTS